MAPVLIKKIVSALRAAVQDALKPDPSKVAIFLSGGLDSAVIQAIARLPNRLYCITWPEQNNLEMAQVAALGGEVTSVTFTKEEMIAALPEVSRACNPIGSGSWSQVCQWFAAKRAKEDGAEVVLTGETSDEIFGGYSRYRILWYLDQMMADPLLESYQGIIKRIVGTPEEIVLRLLTRTLSQDQALAALESFSPDTRTMVDAARRVDFQVNLPPLMVNETNMIEAHGLKPIYPFADPRVLEAAALIPPDSYISQCWNKAPLRQAAKILGVPDQIIDEKTKRGLFIPQDWRPADAPLWSTDWFVQLMKDAH